MIPARGMPGQYEEGVVHRFTKQWYHVIYTGQWYRREGCQVSMEGWSTVLLNSGTMSPIQDNDTGERDARSLWRSGGPLFLHSGFMSSMSDALLIRDRVIFTLYTIPNGHGGMRELMTMSVALDFNFYIEQCIFHLHDAVIIVVGCSLGSFLMGSIIKSHL